MNDCSMIDARRPAAAASGKRLQARPARSSSKLAAVLVTALASVGGTSAGVGADAMASDPLTRLPLPAAGAPILLFEKPQTFDDVPVCKSKGRMSLYSGRSGTVSAAVAWYAGHLSGFRHLHGMGSGRSQDAFYNTTGTLMVGITGKPGAEGQDTAVYSVTYATIQPGVSEKVIAGLNTQKLVCP